MCPVSSQTGRCFALEYYGLRSVSLITGRSERDEGGGDTAHTLLEQCHLQERRGRDSILSALCGHCVVRILLFQTFMKTLLIFLFLGIT